jgi:hypothetical protein
MGGGFAVVPSGLRAFLAEAGPEADDGVVVDAVVLREAAAAGVVGVALGVVLRCQKPAVTVAPERQPSTVMRNSVGIIAAASARIDKEDAAIRRRPVVSQAKPSFSTPHHHPDRSSSLSLVLAGCERFVARF